MSENEKNTNSQEILPSSQSSEEISTSEKIVESQEIVREEEATVKAVPDEKKESSQEEVVAPVEGISINKSQTEAPQAQVSIAKEETTTQESAGVNPENPHEFKDVPDEIKGWNWGAFAFNIFWGIGNKTYLPLLCLIPIFNIAWIFVCGAKGNEWAWQSGNYSSVAEFKLVQASWKRAGVVQAIVMAIGMFLSFIWFILILIFATSFSYHMHNQYNTNRNESYYNDYYDDYDDTEDSGSINDFPTWTQEIYDSIHLATESIDPETNVAVYKDGTSYKDLVGLVGTPDSTYRTANTIEATWRSDSYGYITVDYDVTSGLIIDKDMNL